MRLGELASTSLGKTLDKAKNTGTQTQYLCSINVYWDGINLTKLKDALFNEDERRKYSLEKGDLLICEGGDIGRCAIWDKEIPMCYQNALHRVRFYDQCLPMFYKYLIELYKGIGILDAISKGVTIKHLVQSALQDILIPLPPLAEQKRIVEKIEALLPFVEEYEKAEKQLTMLNAKFPDLLKKSILQDAIQGKLVPQDPTDEPASVLLERIHAEKKKLIKEGKIKKEKQATFIFRRDNSHYEKLGNIERCIDDEIPFNIPDSWQWVRLGNVGIWKAGATPARHNKAYYGGKIPWLKTGDLNDGIITTIPETITDLALKETSVKLNPAGSVLIAMYGATIGKLGILKIDATTNQACCACEPYCGAYNKFLFYSLLAKRADLIKMGEGGAQPNISREKIVSVLIPLPPLAEQKRIVEKIEVLLAEIDQLTI